MGAGGPRAGACLGPASLPGSRGPRAAVSARLAGGSEGRGCLGIFTWNLRLGAAVWLGPSLACSLFGPPGPSHFQGAGGTRSAGKQGFQGGFRRSRSSVVVLGGAGPNRGRLQSLAHRTLSEQDFPNTPVFQ